MVDLIQLKEVSKEYGKHSILQDVNLTIEEGDIYGIIGESGSGKTTLLNLITGFIEPSKGEVSYFSKITSGPQNLTQNLDRIKRILGFTPQHNSFYPKLTVKENLRLFGRLYGIKNDILLNNINSLLDFTNLKDHGNKLAEHLSGGMQKRLDLSCSLVHKPKIWVLDEPTSDLDPILQKEILSLLRVVNQQGVTIIIASHQLDGIESICNKVAIVHKGKIDIQGKIEEIKKPFLKDYFTINLGQGENKEQIISRLKKMPLKKIVEKDNKLVIYPENIERTVNTLLGFIKDENLYLHDVDLRKPSLSEIFERIVEK